MNDQGATSALTADPTALLVSSGDDRDDMTERAYLGRNNESRRADYLTVTVTSFDGSLMPAMLTARTLK